MRTPILEITDELVKKIETMSDTTRGDLFKLTEAEKELLLKYWPIKSHIEIAKMMGLSIDKLRKEYRKLKEIGR